MVSDQAGQRWILRRPPIGQVASTAHNMEREHRIIAALDGHVPVPKVLLFCDDESVTGAPFVMMDFVKGVSPASERDAEETFSPSQRRAASENLVDTLAQIHGVDVDEVGLGDLGKREDYLLRQLRRWRKQWDVNQVREVPEVDQAFRILAERIPTQQGAALVHGDYKFDNVLFATGGEVLAVVDWELCTLGDPIADLAALVMLWTEPGERNALGQKAASSAAGMLTRSEIVERYRARSSRSLDDLDYYLAFTNWRVACVTESVYSRLKKNMMGDHPTTDPQVFGDAAQHHASLALELASAL
ncbi:phosphotransferase family protein [Rhodococcus opacus]|uniref:phosphotransferase family protein n=1 Tax=Rhodococcus opacus TaxID=37919 RepID=UPI00130DEB03|nr:phosphotransferase family protein [Rhodococcus opacus]